MALRRDAGFTLVEQLVVIAVIAVTLAAIGGLVGASARGAYQIERRVSLIQAANNILFRTMSSRDELTDPRLEGIDWDHRWQAALGPAQDAIGQKLPENSRWVPMSIELQVRGPSGSAIQLRTIRLQRMPSQ